MKNIKFLFFTFLIGAFNYNCKLNGKIEIEDFTVINNLDDSLWNKNKSTTKTRYYLVNNFNSSKFSDEYLDKFACRKFLEDKKKYEIIVYYFFKKTNRTNNKSIEKNPRELDRYSFPNDYIKFFSLSFSKKAKVLIIDNHQLQSNISYRVNIEIDSTFVTSQKEGINMPIPYTEQNMCFRNLLK